MNHLLNRRYSFPDRTVHWYLAVASRSRRCSKTDYRSLNESLDSSVH